MIPRRTILVGAAWLAGAAAGSLANVTFGQEVGADLNISPKRLVFDPQGRSAVVYVFNRGSAPATYSIDLVDRAMTPDGEIRDVAEVGKTPDGAAVVAKVKSAKSMIIYTPRRVTLAAGASQVVRLQVLRPGDLADGEYRTHLTVSEVPPETSGLTAEEAAGNESNQVSVKVTALFAVSIPIIVRQGPAGVRAGIEGVTYAVRDTGPGAPPGAPAKTGVVSLQLVREGPSSLFGDVEVRALKGGKPADLLGGLRGIGVYPEVDRRQVDVPLVRAAAPGETLMVIFRDEDAKPGIYLASARYTAG